MEFSCGLAFPNSYALDAKLIYFHISSDYPETGQLLDDRNEAAYVCFMRFSFNSIRPPKRSPHLLLRSFNHV